MIDPTESIRRQMIAEGVTPAAEERTWTTEEMRQDFEPLGFQAPFITVRRRSDGKLGSLKFRGGFGSIGERIYFGWQEHTT